MPRDAEIRVRDPASRSASPVDERLGPLLEHVPSFAIRHLLERDEAGAHADGIRAQRSGLIDRAGRRDEIHQIGAAAVRRDRKPAADDLAVADEIGNDAEHARGALEAAAEAGDDLVEDEERARVAASRDEVLEPRLPLRQQAVVGRHGLEDDGREIVARRRERLVDRAARRRAARRPCAPSVPSGMPALDAAVGPARPLPARTSMPSACPW